jgi:Protein of unknown function (DUF1997)
VRAERRESGSAEADAPPATTAAWVKRLDSTSFRFSLPVGAMLEEMMGVPAPEGLRNLLPAITVTTAVEAGGSSVLLQGTEASLGASLQEESDGFELTFSNRMSWSGGPGADDEEEEEGERPPGSPPRFSFSGNPGANYNGDILELVAENEEEGLPTKHGWELRCAVEAQGQLAVPPPLASLPGPLLGGAGSLLARAVMQAMLPRFADLLVEDYGKWCRGQSRTQEGLSLPQGVPDSPE